jgi:hypothetical protein
MPAAEFFSMSLGLALALPFLRKLSGRKADHGHTES